MRTNLLAPALVAASLALGACGSLGGDPARDRAEELASWLTGVFDNQAQHDADPKHYFPIRLVMCPIWRARADGPWLYVEQAVTTKLEKPYRQRVYRVVGDADGAHVDVYELPGDPLTWAGAWTTPAPLADLAPESLQLREGCTVFLTRAAADRFEGGTRGTGCASSLGGAAYATSEVTVTSTVMRSWDRGFDDKGEQAWGATEGPYEFVKRSSELAK